MGVEGSHRLEEFLAPAPEGIQLLERGAAFRSHEWVHRYETLAGTIVVAVTLGLLVACVILLQRHLDARVKSSQHAARRW